MPNYKLDVLVHGKPVKKYRHKGLIYIEGRKNTEYTIRFRNNTWRRVLAVISVDGLSIMDGEPADFESSGYVVNPYNTVDIPGWRLNDDEIAKFKFGGKNTSYAKKVGKPKNIGVIGCAVFQEEVEWDRWHWYTVTTNTVDPYDYGTGRKVDHKVRVTSTAETMPVPCAGGVSYSSSSGHEGEPMSVYNVSTQNIGTQFGKASNHRVQEVEFERGPEPDEVIQLHYDDRQGLEKKGIRFSSVKANIANPFPAQPRRSHGCKPPKGWRR